MPHLNRTIEQKASPTILETLREAEEYFDQRADADNGIPNTEMRLLIEVRACIAKIGVQS